MENYFSVVKSPERKAHVSNSKIKSGDVAEQEKHEEESLTTTKIIEARKKEVLPSEEKPILIVNEDIPSKKAKSIGKKSSAGGKGRGKKAKVDPKSDKNATKPVADSSKSTSQSTITQHFPVRRSERRTKSQVKQDEYERRAKRVVSADEEGLEIRVLPDKGRGVFASRLFAKDEVVCEYAGDLVSVKEAKSREQEYSQSTEFGCYMYYFSYKNRKYCVDATMESNRLGRLLNHSKTCSNVHTELIAIKDIPHLILVASRNIELGEELLYDYGDRSKESLASHPWLKV